MIPAPRTLLIVGCTAVAMLVALLAGLSVRVVTGMTSTILIMLTLAVAVDGVRSRRAWRRASPQMTRRLPAAFAVGVRRQIELSIEAAGPGDWGCVLYDHAQGTVRTDGLPLALVVRGRSRVSTTYDVTPTVRGDVIFAPADVRVRSRWGLCELLERLGPVDRRRVYPDFAAIARYAWLSGDRRLQEIGIKTYQQRGQGTDFKQLSEYRTGDPVRHIDWRATLRHRKPIVREFQDERDQNVLLLVDCGRRMRADDRLHPGGTTHFDQVLNAVMLLTYVALKQGDAVGAMTFATAPEPGRAVSPRTGTHTLNALMSQLYAIQPTAAHPDYVDAAQRVLRYVRKRALVVVITNFRGEDGAELAQALRLLRSRHLVLVASLRERVVGELIGQGLSSVDAAIDVASAHLFEQERRDAFAALAARDGMMIDAEPEALGVALVNRYHALKRAGVM